MVATAAALVGWYSDADQSVSVRQDHGHSPDTAAMLRAVHPQMRWNGRQRCWVFPYSPVSVFTLHEGSRMLGLSLQLDARLERVRLSMVAEQDREHEVRKLIQAYIDNPKLPIAAFTTLQTPPPYRHQAIAYHWSMRSRVIYLMHKMGLGKTREGADIIRGKYEIGTVREPEQFWCDPSPSVIDPGRDLPGQWCIRGGVLITCPSAVVSEWLEQLWRWQGIRGLPIVSRNPARKRYLAGTPAWAHICGYDSLEAVERNEYDLLVADEGHYIASEDSNRFKRLSSLRQHARSVVMLSGTAMSNGLDSLWSQFLFLDGGRTLGPTREAFKKRFIDKDTRPAGLSAAEAVSRAISRVAWPLSMQEAFPDKPQKIHKTVYVPMTEEQARYYETIRSAQEADVLTGKVTLVEAMTRLTKLLQVTQGFVLDDDKIVQQFSSAKLKALEELITGKGELADRKVIVWCRFRPELAIVSAMLRRHGVQHLELHGDSKKDEIKKAWNTEAKHRVLVGMVQMGIGLNLHAPECKDEAGKLWRCSTTIFYGLDYKVTQIEQAMDRVYRSDQKETCLYVYLLSDDLESEDVDKKPVKPIDCKVYESLMSKLENATEVNEGNVRYVRSLLAS